MLTLLLYAQSFLRWRVRAHALPCRLPRRLRCNAMRTRGEFRRRAAIVATIDFA